MCIVHYTILSVIFCHCVQFAHCLLCVRILHLWTLWILTFLLSHHTISNFLLYDFMIMSFWKCKISTFLHCSYYIFFFYFFTTNPWNHVTYLINFQLHCLQVLFCWNILNSRILQLFNKMTDKHKKEFYETEFH